MYRPSPLCGRGRCPRLWEMSWGCRRAACCLCGLFDFDFFGGGRSQVSAQGYADVQCMCMSMWVGAGMSLGFV